MSYVLGHTRFTKKYELLAHIFFTKKYELMHFRSCVSCGNSTHVATHVAINAVFYRYQNFQANNSPSLTGWCSTYCNSSGNLRLEISIPNTINQATRADQDDRVECATQAD